MGSKNPKQKFHLLIKNKNKIQSPLTACGFCRYGHDAHGLSLNVFAQRNDPRAIILVGPQHCSQQPVCPVEVVAVHSQAEAVLRGGLHNYLDTQWDTMLSYAVQKLREIVLCDRLHDYLDTQWDTMSSYAVQKLRETVKILKQE